MLAKLALCASALLLAVLASSVSAQLDQGPTIVAADGGVLQAIKQLQALRAQVASDKAAVAAALTNPEIAAVKYVGQLLAQAGALKAQGFELPAHLNLLMSTSRAAAIRGFIAGLQKIVLLNAGAGADLSYGINDFTWMTEDQFKLYLSTIPDASSNGPPPTEGPGRRLQQAIVPTSCSNYLYRYWDASIPAYSNPTPDSIDWRMPGVASPFATVATTIRNQGQCGSCVAFSSFAVYEASYVNKYFLSGVTASNVDFSEREGMQCMSGNQCAGAALHYYAARAICNGVVSESVSPYSAYDNNICPVATRTKPNLSGYAYVDTTELAFRKALLHNPLQITVDATSLQYYRTGVLGCTSPVTSKDNVNHAVTIVAYSKATNTYTVRNSWGSYWGMQGTFQLQANCPSLGYSTGALNMYRYRGLLNLRPNVCQVVIRPNTAAAAPLSLSQVTLVNSAGAAVTGLAAEARMTTMAPGTAIAGCFDGDATTPCTALLSGSALAAFYPCSGGLSAVSVTGASAGIGNFAVDVLYNNAYMATYDLDATTGTQTLPFGQCSVSIRPSAYPVAPAGTVLGLAEVQLFSASGPVATTGISLSSTAASAGNVTYNSSNCADGNTGSFDGAGNPVLCMTSTGDAYPTLTATYACAFTLSRVVVSNRQGSAASNTLESFSVDLTRNGVVSKTVLSPFLPALASSLGAYTISA